MNSKHAQNIISTLGTKYTDKPSLNYATPYQLLVAVVLSAQCTDNRVNQVTEKLFAVAPTPQDMLKLSLQELEGYIFSCGLYHSKATHILSLSKDIVERFNGVVPNDYQSLNSLAGVGRKTANVVYSVAFNGQAIAVDTHVFRVAERIGFTTNSKTPLQTEKALMKYIPKEKWRATHHYLIYLGRDTCKAGTPNCSGCVINGLCKKNIKK